MPNANNSESRKKLQQAIGLMEESLSILDALGLTHIAAKLSGALELARKNLPDDGGP